jgi:aspartate aminotransferase
MTLARTIDNVDISGLRKMFDLARSDSINLGLGEPDFQPPGNVKEALKNAIEEGKNKYGSSQGLLQLREAIADKTKIHRDDITRDDVMITIGGTEALWITSQVLFQPGDEVLIPDPGFVLYTPHIQLAGATPVFYPLVQDNEFVPDIEALKEMITDKTKGIYVNSPSNPTGGVFCRDDVKAVTDLARDHDLAIISDEVYEHIIYDDCEFYSFLGDYDKVIQIHSFSKTYALTGWRMGYLVTKSDIMKKLIVMHYHNVACPTSPFQHAALAALQGPQDSVRDMVTEFKTRRDLIVSELNSINGFKCISPKGAFYAFPKFEFEIQAKELVMKLAEAGLICTHGSAFGEHGEGHLRFSYATSQDNIRKGMEILRNVVENL